MPCLFESGNTEIFVDYVATCSEEITLSESVDTFFYFCFSVLTVSNV